MTPYSRNIERYGPLIPYGERTRTLYRPDGWCQHRLNLNRALFRSGQYQGSAANWNSQITRIPVPIPSNCMSNCVNCHSFISLSGQVRFPTGVDFTFVYPNKSHEQANYFMDTPGHAWWATRSSGTLLSPWIASQANLYDAFNDVDTPTTSSVIYGLETRMRFDGVILWQDPTSRPGLFLRIIDWGPYRGESIAIRENITATHFIIPCSDHIDMMPKDYKEAHIDGDPENIVPPCIKKT